MLRGDGNYAEKTDMFSAGLVYLLVLFAPETITFVKEIRDIFVILQSKAETSVLDCPDMLMFPAEVALIKKLTNFIPSDRYDSKAALEALDCPGQFYNTKSMLNLVQKYTI